MEKSDFSPGPVPAVITVCGPRRRISGIEAAARLSVTVVLFSVGCAHNFPITDAPKAHRLLEGRQSMGKIVLKVLD
jgi:hypothetical protein